MLSVARETIAEGERRKRREKERERERIKRERERMKTWTKRGSHVGGVRPPSPPRHDTTAPEEPTPTRVQPPRQAKTKDADFHYTK